ncbi:hypothetical protein FE783_24530 [Paenibacillus mesophilus]|uniref:hypothetical protein n=1 Tax=Paenibacillus mesophilus TaxID=2582849 RepID=UPI00110DF3B2|nr:hypothetical protein [Paenibacillus mesophilus]TMV46810.1 hypothetical protein FE783_24530 [Paenibacillus mesophilus]
MKLFVTSISTFIIALFIASDCSAKQQPQYLMSLGGILNNVTEVSAPLKETVETAVKVVEPVTSKLPEVAAPLKETVETAAKVVEPVTSKLPEAAAPLKETVETVVKVVEPVTNKLPEAVAPLKETVETAVKVVEPVTSKLPEAVAPLKETVETVVKVLEPVADTLQDVTAPIQEIVHTAVKTVEPVVSTLVETVAPVTDTVENSIWKAVKPTAETPVEPTAPSSVSIQPYVQPTPDKPIKDEKAADHNVSAYAERVKETPFSLQPQFPSSSPGAVEELSPTSDPEAPLTNDVVESPSAAVPASTVTTQVVRLEKKVPQPHTLITPPAVGDREETPDSTLPEVEVQGTDTPTINDFTALHPQKQGITSSETAAPVVEQPAQSSRKIEERKPLSGSNPAAPITENPPAVLQSAQSCPNYSKISGPASSSSVFGILIDDVQSGLKCRILLWVRSIELYKKWSNAPPGHPPKASFSRAS